MSIDIVNKGMRTDLVYEDALSPNSELPIFEKEFFGNKVYRVTIPKTQEERYQKKAGIYYTIISDAVVNDDYDELDSLKKCLSETLREIYSELHIEKKASALLVGLGNKSVTPDALGPFVMERVIISRHLYIIDESSVAEGIREVSGITPGVMGQTGIETVDVIRSIVNEVKPDFVVIIDALAARSVDRINRTIQITDAGINPGSGVGNKRKNISTETLGIPVIAIGVPTVVDVASIVSDTMDYILKSLNDEEQHPTGPLVLKGMKPTNFDEASLPNRETTKHYFGEIGLLNSEEKYRLIDEVLSPNGYNLMVTPKEIDEYLEAISEVIANAIDTSLHSAVEQ